MASETDTAVCEVCGESSYDNEDPDTGQLWCRKCGEWRWFKWPKTGQRHARQERAPRRDGFPHSGKAPVQESTLDSKGCTCRTSIHAPHAAWCPRSQGPRQG